MTAHTPDSHASPVKPVELAPGQAAFLHNATAEPASVSLTERKKAAVVKNTFWLLRRLVSTTSDEQTAVNASNGADWHNWQHVTAAIPILGTTSFLQVGLSSFTAAAGNGTIEHVGIDKVTEDKKCIRTAQTAIRLVAQWDNPWDDADCSLQSTPTFDADHVTYGDMLSFQALAECLTRAAE